jgi:hypothetical protein
LHKSGDLNYHHKCSTGTTGEFPKKGQARCKATKTGKENLHPEGCLAAPTRVSSRQHISAFLANCMKKGFDDATPALFFASVF